MPVDEKILSAGEKAKEIITAIRDLRNRNQIKPKEQLALHKMKGNAMNEGMSSTIIKLANLKEIAIAENEIENAFSFLVGADKYFLESTKVIDASEEKIRLEKELDYHKGFLQSVMKKLSNEKFVAGAKPDVIANERKKATDAEEKIRLIEEQLSHS
jgi:valyl-tRNA synthetase